MESRSLGPKNLNVIQAAALGGILGPVLFGSVLIVLTLLEEDFMRRLGWSPFGLSNTDWPSGLALGQYGYIMSAAFLLNGVMVVLFGLGLWKALPPIVMARAATLLMMLAGVAMMGLTFATDASIRHLPPTIHGRIHDACFAALGSTLFPSMLIFGRVFRQSPAWRGLSTYPWVTAVLAIPTFAFKGASFYLFLGAVLTWTLIVSLKLRTASRQWNIPSLASPPCASKTPD